MSNAQDSQAPITDDTDAQDTSTEETFRKPLTWKRMTDEEKAYARAMIDAGTKASAIARTLGVSVGTIYKHFPGVFTQRRNNPLEQA